MSAKPKSAEAKVPVLKGQEAEDKVLEYIKRMNRPFGAVDVSANLKGAVPKTATQKILVALADKGELVQKTYGKTTFFVANQEKLDEVSLEQLTALEAEHKDIEEENKTFAADVRSLSIELTKLRATPTEAELAMSLEEAISASEKTKERLQPLRSGTPVLSTAELSQLDADWTKWRAEWVKRKKIFTNFWQLATDPLPPQEASELAEDLGVELDTSEHAALERGPFCVPAKASVLGKRRR